MTYSFDTLFQSAVSSDSLVPVSIEVLLDASKRASTSQYDLNRKKVDAIKKSFIKGEPLLIAPSLCDFGGEGHLISGRHRVAAIDEFTREYGINAKGKPELITEVNRADLSPISRNVLVDAVSVSTQQTLSALILASNDSRVMTAPEKASVKSQGGYATPGDKFKLLFAPILSQYFESLADTEGNIITVTAVTLAQICGELRSSVVTNPDNSKSKVGITNLMSATTDQLHMIASQLAEYLNEQPLPTKFAQFHRPFIVDFLCQPIELEDEDGEPVVNYDSDGHEIEVTYAQHVNSLITVEPKVSKAPKKSAVDMAAFEKMQAKLLAMGVDVSSL